MPPYATVSEPAELPQAKPLKWRLPLLLFVATVGSIFTTGYFAWQGDPDTPSPVVAGIELTVALLAILLAHEFGHFTLARIHRVNASLPMFIPLPLLSPFGTMGAVIVMKDRIKSRNALLDIGASGPLAGMVVALPTLAYGLSQSPIKPLLASGAMEGQCLLYWLMKRIVVGPIPEGHDVFMSPIAFAGWIGLFVTMLNLIPVGQLDGGHVAYALFGPRQNRIGRLVRYGVLGLFPLNIALFAGPHLLDGTYRDAAVLGAQGGLPWLVYFLMLTVMAWLGGGDHPPTNDSRLSAGRKAIAVFTLFLFVLLFMPTPWLVY